MSHTLLAALPVKEVVTTNYDTLFELASEGVSRPTAVLPYAPDSARSRWLLKLHGCVTRPPDIVLTREDYLRYGERRAALAGIVQAMLITRYMLFVGFSLSDDNFHRIADDVRKAMQGTTSADSTSASTRIVPSPTAFGTTLTLAEDHLLAELWKNDIECVSMVGSGERSGRQEAERRLLIFLDYLLAESTDGSAFLLDPDYRGMLSQAETRLADYLSRFSHDLPTPLQSQRGWSAVEVVLRQLGQRDRELQSGWGAGDRGSHRE